MKEKFDVQKEIDSLLKGFCQSKMDYYSPCEDLEAITNDLKNYLESQNLRENTSPLYLYAEELFKENQWYRPFGIAFKFDKYCPPILEDVVKTPEELEVGKEILKKLSYWGSSDCYYHWWEGLGFKDFLDEAIKDTKDSITSQNLEKSTLAICHHIKGFFKDPWQISFCAVNKYCSSILENLVKTPEELETGKNLVRNLCRQLSSYCQQRPSLNKFPSRILNRFSVEKYLREAADKAKDHKEFAQNLEKILSEVFLCWEKLWEKIALDAGLFDVPDYCLTDKIIDGVRKMRKKYGDFNIKFKPEKGEWRHLGCIDSYLSLSQGEIPIHGPDCRDGYFITRMAKLKVTRPKSAGLFQVLSKSSHLLLERLEIIKPRIKNG